MTYSAYDETHLPTATRIGSRRSYSRMSWGSVLAGAVVAGASMILLSLLGVALGAGGLRFTQTTASDMAGYGLGAGIWSAVNLILSMGFGAYVAARLSGTHSHLDAELHGITVWAVAILLVTVLLAQAVGAILGYRGVDRRHCRRQRSQHCHHFACRRSDTTDQSSESGEPAGAILVLQRGPDPDDARSDHELK